MKTTIKEIFQNVNEWLKFAEAKHAGLIILNSGIIFGILTVYKDYKDYFHWLIIYSTISLLGFSMLLTLISFFPKMKNKVKDKDKPENPNLYFFGHLSLLSEDELSKELLTIYPEYKLDKIDKDIINQIIVNSNIASRKYKLFKCAIIFTILGLIVPLISLIIFKIWH